jgi:putative ABC transport system permease protein
MNEAPHDWKRIVRARLYSPGLRPERELEVVEELALHLEATYERARAEGATPEAAYQRALAAISDWQLLECELRRSETPADKMRRTLAAETWIERKGGLRMETLWQDLRYGARMLLKRPGFSLIITLTLALGIGVNTAIFSVVYSVLLRPLPYEASEKLMALYSMRPQQNSFRGPVSAPDFLDWRAQNKVFDGMSAYAAGSYTLTGGELPERFSGLGVSANFFEVLRVKPLLGRAFLPEEEEAGRNRVVVLSYGLWQRRFGADPNLVGKPINLNGESYVVVGVAPNDFRFAPVELYLPLTITPDSLSNLARGSHFLRLIARLKDGTTVAQAKTEMENISRRIEQQHPVTNTGKYSNVIPYQQDQVRNIRQSLLVLLGAVSFVLLIACANVANLLLARAATRQREMVVRTALGAGRGRIVRQLLTESLILSLLGGGLGLLLAYWGADVLVRAVPSDIANSTPGWQQIGINPQVLTFTLLVSLLTGLVFGLVPALQVSKPDLTAALKEGGKSSAGLKRQRARNVLVVAEIALALVLLIGAGLLIKSFQQLQQVTLGFNPSQLFVTNVSLGSAKYREMAQQLNFFEQVLQSVEHLPGVLSAATVNLPPFSFNNDRVFTIAGQPEPAPDAIPNAEYRVISPQYFRTLEIPLIKGRVFTEQDGANAPRVVIINEALARRYCPNEDPLGKQIKLGRYMEDNPPHTIVGIVGNIKNNSLAAEFRPEFYYPYAQTSVRFSAIVARTQGNPLSLTAAVRSAVLEVDKEQPITSPRTMEMAISDSVTQQRLNVILLGIFGVLALVLAALGIYGVMAYSVTQRTHELGIRLALGAQRQDVLSLIITQGMKLALSGVALGLLAAFALTRLMERLLFGVDATDPLTFAVIAVGLLLVALLACWIPARRATRVDPMLALRCE